MTTSVIQILKAEFLYFHYFAVRNSEKRWRALYLIIALTVFNPGTVFSQAETDNTLEEMGWPQTTYHVSYKERGLPYIQNYSREDYLAGPDNWAIVQSREGLMYFGNKQGVLEYDGVSWRLIQLSNQSVARSMAIDRNNTIYVGGKNDLGFLAPDSTGQMNFVSLKNNLAPDVRDFQNIWFTHTYNQKVYFSGFNYLMEWDGQRFKVRKPEKRFRFSRIIDGTFYIVEEKSGLQKMVNDSLQTVLPQSEMEGVQIYGLAPHKDGRLLALSYQNGLFLIEQNSMIPYSGSANDFIKNKFTYHLERLPNGWYSIATLREGLIVIDEEGQIVQRLNKEKGLVDNSIYYQYTGRQNGLWVATSQGISRIEMLSPFTIYDERLGVEGFVSKLARHQGALYMAGNQGILRLDEMNSQTGEHRFELIEPIKGSTFQGFDLLSLDQSLFALANPGLYEIRNGEVINEFSYRGSKFFRSRIDTSRIYVGLFDGLASLRKVNGEWIDEGRINGIVDDIRDIVEEKSGDLWLKSQTSGIWRVDFSDFNDSTKFHNPSVKHFKPDQEIPTGSISLSLIDDEPVFGIDGKVYRYQAEKDSIVEDKEFGNRLGLTNTFTPKLQDKDGNIWLFAHLDESEGLESRIVAVPGENDTYKIKRLHDERISQLVGFFIFPEENGVVWYGGSDGLVRHNTNIKSNADYKYQPYIRRITVNGDSLVFGGASGVAPKISIPYKSNNLRFEFAAPSFDDESANQYQFYLDGFDENWSAWTSEIQRDYTNIPGGNYTFRLRARDSYGTESSEASLTFDVLPPWYRTWWAYIVYAISLVGFIVSLVHWRSKKLQEEKRELQRLVDERTQQVQLQAEQLKELDEAKSRFFANISHEFRTPLTLILGQVQQLESERERHDPQTIYKMIKRNGNRLLTLVNQLLDLSTLESGKMELRAEKTELISFLKPIVAAYESLAESKKITFISRFESEQIPVYLDLDKIEKVIQNVISNAFKFTYEGGKITISVTERKTGEKRYAQIIVEDNGRGIASDQVNKIFDRFYQGGQSGGSGIGLALSKELITLHKGSISVESTLNEGSRFTISLPLGKEHLSNEEIAGKSLSKSDDLIEISREVSKADGGKTRSSDDELTDIEIPQDLPQILIVEDNADMRQYIRQILQIEYEITEATDGSDGWEKAAEMIPDLIISDVMMPDMDGFELCGKLKEDERTSHIPVILLTAKAGKESKIEGLEHHADDYLTKPFDADELLVLLKNRIEQRARLRERFSREVTLQPKEISITSADERFIQRAMDIVEENMDNFDFSVEIFVEKMHLGRTQVNKKIKALTDLTPVQFIRSLRLKRAAQKIEQDEDTISQIAYSVGFNNLSYFAKCFKEQFGEAPSEFSGKAAEGNES